MTTKPKGAKPKESWATDFEGWNLDAISNPKEWLDGLIRNGVAEALEIIAENNASCFFAIGFDSTCDPLDMAVDILHDADTFEDVSWTFSLADVVARFIDNNSDGVSGDLCDVESARKIRDALRALADELDARMKAKPPEAR